MGNPSTSSTLAALTAAMRSTSPYRVHQPTAHGSRGRCAAFVQYRSTAARDRAVLALLALPLVRSAYAIGTMGLGCTTGPTNTGGR